MRWGDALSARPPGKRWIMDHNKTAIVQLTVGLMYQTAQKKLDAGRCAGSKTGNFQLAANRAVTFTTLASCSWTCLVAVKWCLRQKNDLTHPSLYHPGSAERGGGRGDGPLPCRTFQKVFTKYTGNSHPAEVIFTHRKLLRAGSPISIGWRRE